MLDELLKQKTEYNFKDTIARHSKGNIVALLKSEGYYDMANGGKWVDGDLESISLYPASIVPLSSDDLKFAEGGIYDNRSRKLYCYEKLDKKTKIIHRRLDETVEEYTVMQSLDYADYDIGLRIYYLRRAGEDDTND